MARRFSFQTSLDVRMYSIVHSPVSPSRVFEVIAVLPNRTLDPEGPKTGQHNGQFLKSDHLDDEEQGEEEELDDDDDDAQSGDEVLCSVKSGDNDDINAIQLLGEPDKVKGKGHLHHLSNINSNQTLEHGISLVHTKPEREMRTLIVEGDIATDIEENLFRLGIRWDLYPKKRWQNNTIPYKLSQEYGTREVTMIESALKTFQFLSCLRFEAYNGTQTDYLYIHQSKTRPGCWSYVGRRGGRQDLSLRPPDSTSCHCLCDVGRTLHEVMHALGFYHEHSRPDRDQFIHILSTNVRKALIRAERGRSWVAMVVTEQKGEVCFTFFSGSWIPRPKANWDARNPLCRGSAANGRTTTLECE
eukprot:TCALIF_05235-PA protein Name:"Similar to nas-4 Zinc metalloproteinase nas-4 (Caenorhabditis elegans)" AED:0.42 eAED:0.48 QI:0/0/0/0.14/1/1/7/0/357